MWGEIAGAAGGLLGSAMSAKSASDSVNKQLKFEIEKANNQHQWEVNDLKKAGLNPILSANGGAMPGSIGSSAVDYTQGMNSAIQGIQTALQAKQNEAQVNNLDKDAKLKEAQTINTIAQTDFTKGTNTAKTNAETQKIKQDIINRTQELMTEKEKTLTEKEKTYKTRKESETEGWKQEKYLREIQKLMKENEYIDAREIANIAEKATSAIKLK